MKFLLDTHVWLWLVLDPSRVRRGVLTMLADEANAVFLSVASIHEIVIKHAVGKLALPTRPDDFVLVHSAASGVVTLPITAAHALRLASLPFHHRDPFDRLLIAQANCEQLTLVTADSAIADYPVATLRPW